MKSHNNKLIPIALLCLGIILSIRLAWKVSEKINYDEKRNTAECQAFESFKIGAPEKRFYDEAVATWKVVAQMDPHEGLAEQNEDLGFDGNVGGLVDLFTAKLPPYSFIDAKRNERSINIAGMRWMMSQIRSRKSPVKPVLYYRRGLVYLLYRDDMIQAYEDKNADGEMRSAMYIRK